MAKQRRWRWLASAGGVVTSAAVVLAQAGAPPPPAGLTDGVPLWAFPGPYTKSVPGSSKAYSDVQMFDRTMAVDWFPTEHPPMPDAVKGRQPLYACGFCHLPEGAGRPENAALAGLPEAYFKQQVADMRSGARKVVDARFGPGANMMLTINHAQLTTADTDQAARYYAGLRYRKFTRIVETTDIPRVVTNSFVYVFDPAGPRQPLGERIVEGPDDFERFEMRDPRSTFTAYVPMGAVARGAALATGDGGQRVACEACHGAGLTGSPVGPPIAGRPLTATFRQLYAFQTGSRAGTGGLLMKPILAGLSSTDLIDLAAYVGSLEP